MVINHLNGMILQVSPGFEYPNVESLTSARGPFRSRFWDLNGVI